MRHARYSIAVKTPKRVDAHTLASWRAVADQVAAALGRAGLPVTGLPDGAIDAGAGLQPGAIVEVDPIEDSAGGVFVFWRMPDELALPAQEAILARRPRDPALQRHGRMLSIMIDAMKQLLSESGFAVEDADAVNDLRALEIHVKVGQP